MTDRINALTVVLEKDMRDDDCEVLINAIRCMRNVQSVTGHVSDIVDHVAEERALQKWREKIYRVLWPESKGVR